MIQVYKFLSKFFQLSLNLLFVIQIILMMLVFFTATYWFFNLIGSNAFAFAMPLADSISEFVKIFYNHDIEVGGVYIDGSLLMFDIVALLAVFLISKSKYYVHRIIENIGFSIVECNRKIEKKFNEELKREAEALVKKYNRVAVMIELDAKDMQIDTVWGGDENNGVKEKIDDALKMFYASVKSVPDCTFINSRGRLLIKLKDFNKIDNLLFFIDESIKRIREDMKKSRWNLFTYVAVEVYYDNVDFDTKVLPSLETLLKLRHKNEAVCYGNFNLRYNIKPKPMFYAVLLKGLYDINGGSEIYSLVKKG